MSHTNEVVWAACGGGHAPGPPGSCAYCAGPWCSEDDGDPRWWVIAEDPPAALAAVPEPNAFPIYFGWRAIVERVCIRWAGPEGEPGAINVAEFDDDDTAEVWQITLEGR
jgi:hypothetical protein